MSIKKKFLRNFRKIFNFRTLISKLLSLMGYEAFYYKKIKVKELIKQSEENKGVVFEIGANLGNDTLYFLKKGYEVYCFEPTPLLCEVLQKKYSHLKNFKLMPLAVDEKNDFANFNVAGYSDWGVSSLHELSENINDKYKGDYYFEFNEKITVPTIRLDTFMEIYNLNKKIDYIWIDAQGNDFNVIKSLGEKINYIQSGKCEAAQKVDVYKSKNFKDDIIEYLSKYNFNVKSMDDRNQGMECDIHFTKLNFEEYEKKFSYK